MTYRNDIEYVCVKIRTKNKTIHWIYNAYISPNSDLSIYERHLECINQIKIAPKELLIVVGDFNLPNVAWILNEENCDYYPTNYGNRKPEHFLFSMMDNGFAQMCNYKNSIDNVLDLVFTTDPTLK